MSEHRNESRLPAPPRLLDRLRDAVLTRRYSPRTSDAYVFWARKFILFHGKRHPDTMGEAEIKAFLAYLAVSRKVSPSTQNQALAALLFLYRHVLDRDLPNPANLVRAKPRIRVPVVLSREEIARIFSHLQGAPLLASILMYGSGLRLLECLTLRVCDLDFDRGEILVRQGKGSKDRRTLLPERTVAMLRPYLARLREEHERNRATGMAGVFLPEAVDRTCPEAATEWSWQWLFPASRCHVPVAGPKRRHHLHETMVQRAFARAVFRAGITKHATCHTLRHSFATHLLEASYDIRTIQELMGHRDVGTTMIYTHVLNKGGRGVQSPLDAVIKNLIRGVPQPFQD